jgi:hypothetical protein
VSQKMTRNISRALEGMCQTFELGGREGDGEGRRGEERWSAKDVQLCPHVIERVLGEGGDEDIGQEDEGNKRGEDVHAKARPASEGAYCERSEGESDKCEELNMLAEYQDIDAVRALTPWKILMIPTHIGAGRTLAAGSRPP